jgi:FkbM family methyltransferase
MDSDLGPGSARAFYSQDEIDDVLPYNFKWDDWGSPQREIFASKSKSLSCERRPLPIKRISGKLFNSANVESCRQSLVTRPHESVYGAWTFCESALSPDPVVVSFGIGENMDWEIAMVKDYGATVYAHDPTPKAVEFVKKKQGQLNFLKSPMFVFTEVGLGAFDQDNVTMNLPSNPNFVSGRVGSKEKDSTRSVQIRLLSMESTLKLHGLQGKLIDIVKWDVEGVEFDVLDSLLNDTESTIPAKLLLLEWHARFESDGQSKQKDATEKLERVGFVKMHTSRNNEEEVFLNTRRPSTSYFVAEH